MDAGWRCCWEKWTGLQGLASDPCEGSARTPAAWQPAAHRRSLSIRLSLTRAVLLGGFPRAQHSATLQPEGVAVSRMLLRAEECGGPQPAMRCVAPLQPYTSHLTILKLES
jgi:hypothetical protein